MLRSSATFNPAVLRTAGASMATRPVVRAFSTSMVASKDIKNVTV